jgi:hypothetical protein
MKRIRFVCLILSLIIVAASFVVGLHEMGDFYSAPMDQIEYLLGYTLGSFIWVGMVWAVYGIVEAVLYFVRRTKHVR